MSIAGPDNGESAAIAAAYQDNLKKLFAMLLEGTISAAGDKNEIASAEKRFQSGLATARSTRDRALVLMQAN